MFFSFFCTFANKQREKYKVSDTAELFILFRAMFMCSKFYSYTACMSMSIFATDLYLIRMFSYFYTVCVTGG